MAATTILCGDSRELLQTLEDGSVQCAVTSPPYFNLRDYGIEGQIGLEASVDEYVCTLVDLFREVRRVLRPDGTLWLNLGDSFASQGGRSVQGSTSQRLGRSNVLAQQRASSTRPPTGLKAKDLIGIPWRVAFALQAKGWFLRSEIIWAKTNPMPESVRDRPTKAHETIFLLTKNPRYFYDAEAVREPHASTYSQDAIRLNGGVGGERPVGNNFSKQARHQGQETTPRTRAERAALLNPNGRNRRSVWTVSTRAYKGAHFAVYPEALIEPCIKAGSSEVGQCSVCGSPWKRIVERTPNNDGYPNGPGGKKVRDPRGNGASEKSTLATIARYASTTIAWEPTCSCDAGDPVPQLVLDPFFGSGTTGVVANRLGRNCIGLELNPEYVRLAAERVSSSGGTVYLPPVRSDVSRETLDHAAD